MDPLATGLLIGGAVLLIGGAELLVRGASGLAAAMGVSPLVIGLTVVAFGTSAPEMAVSVQSALTGQEAVAIGNAVGSNIFNVLVVLGLSAVIAPLIVQRQLVRLDVPVMIGASVAVWLLALDGTLSRLDGGLLFGSLLLYTAWQIRTARAEPAPATTEAAGSAPWPAQVVMVLVGLGLLVLGSRWLVTGAVALARTFGVSELVIGLTIVAAGTSLPEVATSVTASLRGQRDIAVGNVVGSNLFNLLAVLGLVGLCAPGGASLAAGVLDFDFPLMIAAAVACLPIFLTAGRIDRWEGILFLGYYLAYLAYLLLHAAEHDALPWFSAVMVEFVAPLTAVTIGVSLAAHLRRRSLRRAQAEQVIADR